jgi:hypothetical protein
MSLPATADTSTRASANELDIPDLEKAEQASEFEPIRSTSRPVTTARSRSLYSTRSRQSTGGEDGYSVRRYEDSEDDGLPIDVDESPETKEDKEFEVKWDDESDPMNPRSKKNWRKWSIVIIVAACSLCV